MAEFAAIFTALAVIFVALTLVAATIWTWVWAVGDLIWMVALKPRLIGGALASAIFLIVALGLTLIPAEERTSAYLPLFAAGIIAPVVTRLLADHLARLQFKLGWGKFDFEMDPEPLRQANFFHLIKAQQKALYIPPRAQSAPKNTST